MVRASRRSQPDWGCLTPIQVLLPAGLLRHLWTPETPHLRCRCLRLPRLRWGERTAAHSSNNDEPLSGVGSPNSRLPHVVDRKICNMFSSIQTKQYFACNYKISVYLPCLSDSEPWQSIFVCHSDFAPFPHVIADIYSRKKDIKLSSAMSADFTKPWFHSLFTKILEGFLAISNYHLDINGRKF